MHFPISTSTYGDDLIEFEISSAVSVAINHERTALRMIAEFPGLSSAHSIRGLAREGVEAKICWLAAVVWLLTWVNNERSA